MRLLPPEELPHPASHDDPGDDDVEAMRALYRILDELSASDRTLFALRFIDGLEVTAVAVACELSRTTAKRRLARVEQRVRRLAASEPALKAWVEENRSGACRISGGVGPSCGPVTRFRR